MLSFRSLYMVFLGLRHGLCFWPLSCLAEIDRPITVLIFLYFTIELNEFELDRGRCISVQDD